MLRIIVLIFQKLNLLIDFAYYGQDNGAYDDELFVFEKCDLIFRAVWGFLMFALWIFEAPVATILLIEMTVYMEVRVREENVIKQCKAVRHFFCKI